jgi:SpoIID/LytB domain protein
MRLHDEYLYGISEVPSIWPAAALQSQVIVSRTYALSRMGVIKKDCDCNLYSSKYDQVYDGYAKELLPKYGALWHQAVDATAVDSSTGLAITFNNAPINVYFSASTGGQTQRAVDVWGTDIPYLTSVPDPWSLDPKLNPKYAKWTRVVSQDVMAKAFNLPDVKRYVIDSRTKTGSVLKLTAYSSTGQKSTLPVGTFKVAVKLPSSWFAMPPTITLNSQSKVGATN